MRIQSLAAAILALSTVPATAADPVAPRPVGNPGDWVTPNDYPAAALREDVEGVVRFVLGVAADGSVTDCTVQESSGDPGLDSTTCELLQARSRFTPAQDEDGKPTTGTWKSSVRWQIPSERSLPPIMSLSYRFVVEKDGSISSCVPQADSNGGFGEKACQAIRDQVFEPMTGKDGQPVRSVTTMTFSTERTELSD